MSENIQETNSGISKKGKWNEVARFAEKVEEEMSDSVDQKSVESFKRWRPKEDDEEKDMKRKTIESASLDKSEIEKDSDGVKEEFKDASENMYQAGKKAANRETPSEEIKGASESFAKPIVSEISKAFRKFENIVYSRFALRSERYYLDTEDLSVDLKTTRDGMYRMDVNANSDESRERLKEKFKNG